MLRQRQLENEQWPDGRGILYQPIVLIEAFSEVVKYLNENEPK